MDDERLDKCPDCCMPSKCPIDAILADVDRGFGRERMNQLLAEILGYDPSELTDGPRG